MAQEEKEYMWVRSPAYHRLVGRVNYSSDTSRGGEIGKIRYDSHAGEYVWNQRLLIRDLPVCALNEVVKKLQELNEVTLK